MIGLGKMTANDKKWQAEDDARSLVRAEEIKSDPARMAAARKQAAAQVVERKKDLAATQKVARPPTRKVLPTRKPK